MTEDSRKFITALKDKNLAAIREVPKADLHNHFVLGGNRAYIYEQKRILIEPVKKPLASMKEMDGWNNRYIGGRFPGSNLLLGRIKEMAHHPIERLYRSGLDMTINSDDVLIFDSDVSKEYIRLFETGCLNAEELDHIRLNGLREMKSEV